MTSTAKKRAVAVLLALIAVWPAVHHVLAQRYLFDPWRFFGWAMYSTPDQRLLVNVAAVEDERARLLDLQPPLLDEARQFAHRRSILGKWVSPYDLAQSVLAERTEADGVLIQIRRWVLDRETATIRPHDTLYRYDRGEPEPKFVKESE